MNRAPSVIPLLLMLAGCLSPPLPQDVVDGRPPPAREPLRTQEVERLSQAGISEEVILDLILSRGVSNPPVGTEVLLIREFTIPLWPSYARGRWRIGLRLECITRTREEPLPIAQPPEPRPSLPQPDRIDP